MRSLIFFIKVITTISLVFILAVAGFYFLADSQEEVIEELKVYDLAFIESQASVENRDINMNSQLNPSDAENPEAVIYWSNPTYQNGSPINWREIKQNGN